jgi:hypothetical protein
MASNPAGPPRDQAALRDLIANPCPSCTAVRQDGAHP